jgi:sarcosine oxidase
MHLCVSAPLRRSCFTVQAMEYDVIVIGLGATGGAAFYHLARNGMHVLGLDAASPPHDGGSSHGGTRIYRQAYYEAPEYVPLALRALELWHELEREMNQTLFVRTGALTIGPEHGELVSGAVLSAQKHAIPHEALERDEVVRRFPAFAPPDGTVALFEPTAGVLMVEECIAAHISLARKHGGDARMNETVTALEEGQGQVVVRTSRGEHRAERVIVAAGAWTPRLLGIEHAFLVTRETVHWLNPRSPNAKAPDCPVSMIQFDEGPIFYSIPDFGQGFKAGLHHAGPVTDPSNAPVHASDADQVLQIAERLVPGAAGRVLKSAPCYYTTTADHHFAIGALATAPGIIVASACSGHGFKFAPALGEHLAQLAGESGGVTYPLFTAARLGGATF